MKAHRTDLVSFAFGLLFVALSAWWLLAQMLGLVLPAVGWFLAGGLIMVGVLGLVGALRSSRSPAPPPTEPATTEPATTEPATTEPATTAAPVASADPTLDLTADQPWSPAAGPVTGEPGGGAAPSSGPPSAGRGAVG
ncbi:hypothetical protein GA0070616_1762 [Micromonospora nigra]|uniref:Uncharacterized protein n=1 Tax=Micromonospora nigra TaxID=145857 RepID=A0A1C6RR26_9ACTN|nr:hypothetical protein [Micromonospora nigra]SCL19521.1 hypothetical protein GA0070616_1762 [Micromonospora nigra]